MQVRTKPNLNSRAAPAPKAREVPSSKTGPGQAKKTAKHFSVALRPKRQITLPREICEQLGIEPGDALEVSLEGSALLGRPKKAIALDALREIQEAFRRSGITEKELLDEARKVRHELVRKRYAAKE